MKKLVIRLFLVAMVAAGAWGGYTALKKIPQAREAGIATTKVRQGDVIVRSYARGELQAVRSQTLTAPNLFGTVQVTRLAPLGSFAREKDLVAEFDDSELLSRIEERQLEVDQIDEQMKKAQADLAIRDNQDQVELLRARYAVRRADLEVQRNELLAEIDRAKNLLNLEEAKRRLTQLESDIKSRKEQADAELLVLRTRRNRAVVEMNREKARLLTVKLLAPMSGLIAIRQNRGGYFNAGQTQPDIREGDQLQPGMQVADVLDLSEMEVKARIGELDRANLYEGQDVVMTLDALADKKLSGKIKSMSGTASSNVFSNDPSKKFDVVFSVDMRQLLSHLGASKDYIARVLAQAEANRNKPILQPPVMAMGGFGGGGAEGGRQFGFARGGAEGGRGGGAGMSDEQRTQMRAVMQKVLGGRNMQDLSAEERTQMMTKVQAELTKLGVSAPARGGQRDGQQAEGAQGERGGRARRGGDAEAAGEGGERGGRGRRGGDQVAGEGAGRGGRGQGGGGFGGGAVNRFTEADMQNAKLPPPPEEDNQLDVLLRPGLLADVEIIVEKIPNAIHVPAQAVFEREGGYTVFVREGNRFAARKVKLLKRSENTMVIAEGLKAGEEVALSDPQATPGQKKGGGSGGGKSGAPMMPAGKG